MALVVTLDKVVYLLLQVVQVQPVQMVVQVLPVQVELPL